MVTVFLIFMFLVVLVLDFVLFTGLIGYVFTRVPYVPTNKTDIVELGAHIAITKNDIVYELGSGSGVVAFAFEKHYGVRVTGFELTWWAYLFSQYRKWYSNSLVRFARKNFFKENWSEATIVYCYLFPPLMPKIVEKMKAECKPGTLLLSRDFSVPHSEQITIISLTSRHKIFVYKV